MEWDFEKFGFKLGFKWGYVGGSLGLAIWCQACVPLLLVFCIPPPLYCKKCCGGTISIYLKPACPHMDFTIEGKVFWNLDAGMDFSFCRISFAKLEIGISAGVGWKMNQKCWWVKHEGWRRRRRRWSRRRRNTRHCGPKTWICDVYIKGYVELTILMVRARVDFTYWIRSKHLTMKLSILVYEFWLLWWGAWREVYSTWLGRYYF